MVILRFAGTEPPDYVRRALRRRPRRGRDPVPRQRRRPRAAAPPHARPAPRLAAHEPLICVDQEGGPIRILPWAEPERAAPEQQAWGAGARGLRGRRPRPAAAGVTVTLGPVADVPTVEGAAMADRAFTTDSDAATAAVAESIGGWHEAGVATTVKHFPGLGGATVNTDDGPSVIERTRDQLVGRPPAVRDRCEHGDRVRDGRPRHATRRSTRRTSPRSRRPSSTGCCGASSASRAWR